MVKCEDYCHGDTEKNGKFRTVLFLRVFRVFVAIGFQKSVGLRGNKFSKICWPPKHTINVNSRKYNR